MPRACTICTAKDAVTINEDLVLRGKSNRAISRQYGLHHDAVRRHREHIPDLLVKASAAWLKKLDECAHKRTTSQDQQAAGLMTLDELSVKLSELEDARLLAERELAKLRGVREEIEALERDADALLASYEHATPDDLDALGPPSGTACTG